MAKNTAERVSLEKVDNYVFQRCLKAYMVSKDMVSGDVLEIGTGEGYGVKHIAPQANTFTTIDQFECDVDFSKYSNTKFLKQTIPPISLDTDSFDFVISFQVIEHIKNDEKYAEEIHRVLKKGGKFIVTTPNIKTTLSRNPWHIREYTYQQLNDLLGKYFSKVEMKGVYGNEKVMDYYKKNKESVDKLMKYDIFNLQYNLPRWMLQAPYDYMNNRNRKKLLKGNKDLTSHLDVEDFLIKDVSDECLDLFYICEK